MVIIRLLCYRNVDFHTVINSNICFWIKQRNKTSFGRQPISTDHQFSNFIKHLQISYSFYKHFTVCYSFSQCCILNTLVHFARDGQSGSQWAAFLDVLFVSLLHPTWFTDWITSSRSAEACYHPCIQFRFVGSEKPLKHAGVDLEDKDRTPLHNAMLIN